MPFLDRPGKKDQREELEAVALWHMEEKAYVHVVMPAMATWHYDTTASIRLIPTAISYQHTPAPSRPSIYGAPRALTPRYRTHYHVIRGRRGSGNNSYTLRKAQARSL